MKFSIVSILLYFLYAFFSASAQSTLPFNHPKDQIALQLGAIQMGYTVPFQLVSGNATKAQQAANALLMGRNALAATVAKPAAKVQGFVSSPAIDTVEYRDQLYQAVEAVVTSPVVGSIKGSVSVVGSTKAVPVSASLAVPPNAYTIPVPYALEAATSVDAQTLTQKLISIGIFPVFDTNVNVTTLSGSESGEGVAVDTSGNVYVADSVNHRIRKITPSGTATTLAGGGGIHDNFNNGAGSADGQGTSASFRDPVAVAVYGNGNVYLADRANNRIRKITQSGTVTTLAGSGSAGYADGQGTSASFNYPSGVAVDENGNVYVADTANHRIRKITWNGDVTTLADNIYYPKAVFVDGGGNVYVVTGHRICKITPSGNVTTLAGKSGGFNDGLGTLASFLDPSGVAVDTSGNVYVGDSSNHRIRKIAPSGNVTTLAGSGKIGGDDGQGDTATFSSPAEVAVDGSGNVYVADWGNLRIRKITISK